MKKTASESWVEHIAAWKEGGLSKAEFCRQAGLHYQKFCYHSRRAEIAVSNDFWRDTYFPCTKLHKSAHSQDTEDMFFRVWLAPLAPCPLPKITFTDIEEAVVEPMMKAEKSPRTIQYALAVKPRLFQAGFIKIIVRSNLNYSIFKK